MTEEDEECWDGATDVLGTLFYAFEEGDTEAIPDLSSIRDAVDCLVFLAGWKGLEPNVVPVRRALLGPDVASYAEIVRLTKSLLEEAAERLSQRDYRAEDVSPNRQEDDLF